jgi:hypothetical protein
MGEAMTRQEVGLKRASKDLITEDGRPNVSVGSALVEEALAQSMLIGRNEAATLLRASEAGTTTLLQPAEPDVVNPEQLLHTVTAEEEFTNTSPSADQSDD